MFDKLIKLTNHNLSTASSQEKILEIMPFSLTLQFRDLEVLKGGEASPHWLSNF